MKYKIADDVKVVYAEDNSSVCLTKLDGSDEKVIISGAGPVFVELMNGERDMDDMLEACVRIYGTSVEPYIIAKDLDNFVMELALSGMVKQLD